MLRYLILGGLVAALAFIIAFKSQPSADESYTFQQTPSINGVSFTGPSSPIPDSCFKYIKNINANYVVLLPYAYSRKDKTFVRFNSERQWWGEKSEGIIKQIEEARLFNLKVMIKPHVWVIDQGWSGDFKLLTNKEWTEWEKEYTNYILHFAELAATYNIEAFSIGNEFRHAIIERPQFWPELIKKVRAIYNGQVTYAANWDNFENVLFWDKLDFIGVNAYFPLTNTHNPPLDEILQAWENPAQKLKRFAYLNKKKIVFTEFGYKSMLGALGNQWEIEYDNNKSKLNMDVQYKGYEAIFKKFWNEPWFGGGYLWKWHGHHLSVGGPNNLEYTPQNKPAEQLIKREFGSKSH